MRLSKYLMGYGCLCKMFEITKQLLWLQIALNYNFQSSAYAHDKTEKYLKAGSRVQHIFPGLPSKLGIKPLNTEVF